MAFSPFSPKSIEFIRRHPKDDAFINILYGSVRSGKTWTMIPKLLFGINNYDIGGTNIIFGVSKDTIYQNILNDLFNFVGTRNYSYNRQNGELWLNNVLWNVVGAKDEGSEKYIRGRTVGRAYGDELSLIPRSFFDMMLSRMSVTGARLYGTTNPDSPYHYLYSDYITNEKLIASGQIWTDKFLLDDNLSLDPSTRLRYETMFTGVFRRRFILGEWVVAEGGIYKDVWNDDLLYNDGEEPAGLLQRGMSQQYVGIDYGTGNPTVFLLVADDGKTLWVHREWYYDSRNMEATGYIQKTDSQYLTKLQEFMAANCPTAECIIDPSAASFKAEMTQAGLWHCDAENEVLDGIRKVASLMGRKLIRINRQCKKTIQEHQTYSWDPRAAKIGEDRPIKSNDHTCDNLRYVVQTKVHDYRFAT